MEKWELHCHTAEVSKCSQVLAEKMVSIYIKMGYDGIVVTDHFNQGTFENLESASVEEKINFFLNGYYNTIRAAKNRIKVLLGMELCCGSSNDYLIYGINKTFLKLLATNSIDLRKLSIKEVSDLVHQNNMLLIQAHPFRNAMTIIPPELLDGIETFNGNPRHASRNDIAYAWAEKYNLVATSGSDFHNIGDAGRGGIIVPGVIQNQADLIQAILSHPKHIITKDGFSHI